MGIRAPHVAGVVGSDDGRGRTEPLAPSISLTGGGGPGVWTLGPHRCAGSRLGRPGMLRPAEGERGCGGPHRTVLSPLTEEGVRPQPCAPGWLGGTPQAARTWPGTGGRVKTSEAVFVSKTGKWPCRAAAGRGDPYVCSEGVQGAVGGLVEKMPRLAEGLGLARDWGEAEGFLLPCRFPAVPPSFLWQLLCLGLGSHLPPSRGLFAVCPGEATRTC